jgi:hypothetical protein
LAPNSSCRSRRAETAESDVVELADTDDEAADIRTTSERLQAAVDKVLGADKATVSFNKKDSSAGWAFDITYTETGVDKAQIKAKVTSQLGFLLVRASTVTEGGTVTAEDQAAEIQKALDELLGEGNSLVSVIPDPEPEPAPEPDPNAPPADPAPEPDPAPAPEPAPEPDPTVPVAYKFKVIFTGELKEQAVEEITAVVDEVVTGLEVTAKVVKLGYDPKGPSFDVVVPPKETYTLSVVVDGVKYVAEGRRTNEDVELALSKAESTTDLSRPTRKRFQERYRKICWRR